MPHGFIWNEGFIKRANKTTRPSRTRKTAKITKKEGEKKRRSPIGGIGRTLGSAN